MKWNTTDSFVSGFFNPAQSSWGLAVLCVVLHSVDGSHLFIRLLMDIWDIFQFFSY